MAGPEPRPPDRGVRATRAALALGASLLVLGLGLTLALGSVALPPVDVLRALLGEPVEATTRTIVWEVRLPRALGAALTGGALALLGTTLQAVLQNVLAEPYVLGVSSGASLGVAAAVVLFGLSLGHPFTALSAFAAALGAVLVVERVAQAGGGSSPARLILAGVALSSFTTALTALLLYLAPEATQVRGLVFWVMGGLGLADWTGLGWCAVVVLPACLALLALHRWHDLLALGGEGALSLGLDVALARRLLIGLAALATGAVVAFAGAIGFVGLVVPHALRPLVGAEHRRLAPVSALFGALLLLFADLASRLVLAPGELPVGILTGLCGAPFFLWLLSRERSLS